MSSNQKKVLVDLIKTELKKEIAEIENIPIGNYAPICGISKVAWETYISTGALVRPKKLREMADQLFPKANQPEDRCEGELTASNIEKKDFDEIISLIQQVNKLRQAENKKREQKRKEKLATNPNLFFYWCKSSSGKPGSQLNRRFEGRKDGKEFYLYIPVAHPALTNVSFAGQQSNDNKVNHFYLIEGFKMPTKVHYHDYTDTYFYEKSIKLTDPISIVSCQGNSEEGNKSNSQSLVEPKETGGTVIKTKAIEKIFEEEWKNKDNKNIIDVRIGILIKLFQSLNIRSIELTTTGDLFIKYQGGSSELLGDDSDEKVIIESYLKAIGEKGLDQQKLEKLQANCSTTKSTSPSPTDYTPYLIGGTLVISLLGVAFISYRYRLGKRKK